MIGSTPLQNREIVYVAFSGKRYSGKDHMAGRLKDLLWNGADILEFASFLKEDYAQHLGIDVNLLYQTIVKDQYREGMVEYAREVFREKGTLFCTRHRDRAVELNTPVIIIPDLRFKHELNHLNQYVHITVRVTASDETRRERGWQYDPNLDDSTAETDLDDYTNWDMHITNETWREELNQMLLTELARKAIGAWANNNL